MNLVLLLFVGRWGCQGSTEKVSAISLKYPTLEFFYGQNKYKSEGLYIAAFALET